MIRTVDEVFKALNEQDKKQKKREAKVPKTVTLEGELERMAGLKWKDDIGVFEEVRVALQTGEVAFRGTKLKKDDIYNYHYILEARRREALKKSVRESKPENYILVQELKTWMQIQRLMFQEDTIAWDTETTGLNFYTDRIVGISAYLPKSDIAFYAPFGHRTGERQLSEAQVIAPIKEWLEEPESKSVWHNYKYDQHMLACHGINIFQPYWDTMIVAKLLNEHEESHGLKQLYDKYVAKTGKVVTFSDIIQDGKMAEADLLLSTVYAAGDPHKTFLLYEFQKPFLDTVGNLKNIWYNIESRLLPIDVRMERTGLRIDLARLKEIEKEQLPKINQAEEDLRKSFSIDEGFLSSMCARLGKEIAEFNFSSNDHLGYLIYDHLKLGGDIPKSLGKKERSTAGDVIDAIVESVPELEPMLDYRELTKLVNTYAAKIPEAMEVDGRLHSQFDSLRTRTGRYASYAYGNKKDKKGMNLQNIPSRTELGKEVRKCVIPDPDTIFISSDLSQIEPRVIAHILYSWFGDSSMRDIYIAGFDLYTNSAMQVFDLEQQYCLDKAYDPTHTFQPRKLIKTGQLGYLYGQSVKSFANKMGVEMEVAEKFFNGMETRFPGLKLFREKVLEDLRRDGFVTTLFGRKRRFPEYQKMYARLTAFNRKPWKTLSNAESQERNELWRKCAAIEREAINAVVQGSAADCLKQIILAMNKICDDRGWKYLMSIHDEILLQVPKADVTPETIALINKTMTATVTFSLPLKCDTVLQMKWMEETPPEDWDFERCCPKAA